eukprot:m.32057 g.32057  ORF g.32057 m.32057 type:complete len:169 (+) comp9750_c1_seq4:594-1100(+)
MRVQMHCWFFSFSLWFVSVCCLYLLFVCIYSCFYFNCFPTAVWCKIVFYDDLERMLETSSLRELEDCVLECIDKELLMAKLDQRNRQMLVEWTFGRDVLETDLNGMLATLTKWQRNCESTLKQLDREIADANARKAARRNEMTEHEERVALIKTNIESATHNTLMGMQ